MVLSEVLRELVSFLRYFAAPGVGLAVVWSFDDGHDIIRVALESAWPWSKPPSVWPLVAFIAIAGLVVYFLHRIALHQLISLGILRLATRSQNVPPTLDDLAFARWRRRGAGPNTPARSVQVALDEMNAATHFLYCSGWSALLTAVVFNSAFPEEFSLAGRCFPFLITVAMFLVVGFAGDWRAARWDRRAFAEFPNTHDA